MADRRKCRALVLTDSKPCQFEATSVDQNFCRFHSRQCFALYKGYKRRNAQLDDLTASPPDYLATSQNKLANEDFTEVHDVKTLEEIHGYLFNSYGLVDRVIRARKIHHGHFYAETMDYDHEKYLNSLITQKLTAQKALERVVQRLVEVLYLERKWFDWTRKCQEEEEKQRENEQKKVKREAALFRRQAKELEARMRELRAKEDSRRQEDYLEEAYQESLASRSDESEDEAWDPIEDIMENERGTYIQLIRHFLWLELEQISDPLPGSNTSREAPAGPSHEPLADATNTAETQVSGAEVSNSQNGKKKKKAKGKNHKDTPPNQATTGAVHSEARTVESTSRSEPVIFRSEETKRKSESEPDMIRIEGREEMRTRLLEGTKPSSDNLMCKGADGNPRKFERMPPMPAEEADRLVEEIAEIKNYLFCRLLLNNAVLLPAALKANNLDEFFKNAEIKTQDLRGLCLRLEQPHFQEIRDACADYFRKDDESDDQPDDDVSQDEDSEPDDEPGNLFKEKKHKHHLPSVWQSKREKALRTAEPQDSIALRHMLEMTKDMDEKQGTRVDFGTIDDEGKLQKTSMRVRICGRYIYNYPSQGSMKRKGWLHFSIIAKGCSLEKAAELCKSWDEFFELNILAIHHYFPSPEWLLWAGDFVRQQFLRIGFLPYFHLDDGSDFTVSKRGRNPVGRRIHASSEVRSFICAHMKRNDPVSRRFIQYVSMQTSRMLILVRDGKTGRILVTPPEEELWLVRTRHGYGRAVRAEWETKRYVGPLFFEEMDKFRRFHLGFDDYYDIYIWTADPTVDAYMLRASVAEMLYKANRVINAVDLYTPIAPILKTLTYDGDSWRRRDIREGEKVESAWDELLGSNLQWGTPYGHVSDEMPKHLVYTEADALEDQILFPEDASPGRFKAIENSLTSFESGRMEKFIMKYFIEGGDISDDESDDLEQRYPEDESDDDDTSVQDDTDLEDEDLSSFKNNTEGGGAGDSERHDEHSTAHTKVDHTNAAQDIMLNMFPQMKLAEEILDTFGPGLDEDDIDLEEEFLMCVDLFKSRVFKTAWHDSDLEPGAQERWGEYLRILYDTEQDLTLLDPSFLLSAQVLKHVDYHPETHPKVMKDAGRACRAVMLFSSLASSFFTKKPGSKHKNSMLFNQAERAKHLPDRSSSRSSAYRDDSFYKGLKDALRESGNQDTPTHHGELPMEWDICIRPKIAQLFKHGVICISYANGVSGRAFAGKEEDRPLDLFIDYRDSIPEMNVPKSMVDPYKIKIESLRQDARDFAVRWPNARFALLRLWSAPHFYPFMIGYGNRGHQSFTDAVGRFWEWKFIPTDMPFSEKSVHHNMAMRFKPYMEDFADGKKLKIRKDVILVMGENEEELLKLASAATFIVQTQPWRLEIDFWKSFVNVDGKFLGELNDAWWD